MDNAKKLLAKGHSVLETSIMVGFDSPTSFAAMFKKISGQTPSHVSKRTGNKEECNTGKSFTLCT